MTKIRKDLGEVQAQVDFHCDKMEYLENHSRRNNIRIDEIPEEPDETWEDTESKAKLALRSKLNLPFKVEIERARRTGKANRALARPRTVICRLVSWKQKDPILKAARTVKPDRGND